MDHKDYEKLQTNSLVYNMLAGAIAGMVEYTLVYPLDTVKTRMQSLSQTNMNKSMYSTMYHMIKGEGILRPFRGVTIYVGAGTYFKN